MVADHIDLPHLLFAGLTFAKSKRIQFLKLVCIAVLVGLVQHCVCSIMNTVLQQTATPE